MKSFKIFNSVSLVILCFITFAFASCDQSECTECNDQPCNEKAETVKEVSNEEGVISFDSTENRWMIIRSIDGTYDSQDLGFVCDDLPEEFQEVGKKVVFSGKYKKYAGERKPPIPGQTYFYLFISNISNSQDNG